MTLMSTRLPPEIKKEIEWYAKKEKVARSVALRRILERGLKEVKLEHALDEYARGRVTLWKAAELAGLSLWEMTDVVRKRRIGIRYTPEDLADDLRVAEEK